MPKKKNLDFSVLHKDELVVGHEFFLDEFIFFFHPKP
jgi:hypothetical protein